ncbi:MAG: hypothetical protein H6981_04675 [Gammaproteobacteria bacterium]|nr:hypothetical protein [Gammaproteobacteria bacterium]MCP5136074.1 hypothetical protein [Gammaproteobacteria bacterium]
MVEYLRWYEIVSNDRKDWEYDGDELLPARSAMEFVRDTWTDEERALIDAVDAYWLDHADQVNEFFRYEHARRGEADLSDLVQGGRAPEITTDHWWWYPIKQQRAVA